ncbi:hypothetical protein CHLRE_01g051700v5 [Chlamydomonas reinhardtii]|uniref:RING-type domain-containing protein n=1 Tax=Chlamydomonas reinhardtii TaxID=3055 RepID=A0A2K3E837_CHLRE|nr:uncharacterized protein CHLRE_01g051700v5 [Chlamydomonas reinhardtii]PNW88949.1 hypothetical protein CHLRE_01g051700v5 [Chlamydomonas reinhardtii]
MAGAVDAVDLAAEETPPPRKRLRAEQPPPKEVLSLVDSDDDLGSPKMAARDAEVARVPERYAAGRLWGALGAGAGGAAPGPGAAAGAAAAAAAQADGLGGLARPLYRPPSARFRRAGGTAAARLAGGGQQGDQSAASGPSVIDVADDDDSNDQQALEMEARPQAALLGRSGPIMHHELLRRHPGVATNDAAGGDEADSGPAPAGGGSPQQEQQQHPNARLRQRLVLPRPREARGAPGLDAGGVLVAGAAGAGTGGGGGAGGDGVASAVAAAAAAGQPTWRMRFHTLDLGADDADGRQQRPRRTALLSGGIGAAGGGGAAAAAAVVDAAVGAGQEVGDDSDVPLRERLALRQAAAMRNSVQQAAAQPHGGGAGGEGASRPNEHMSAWARLAQRRLPEQYVGARARWAAAAAERAGAAVAGGSGAAGSRSVAAAGAAGDQEEEDMRMAARLQAEEDERLARETARRMEQEEHRRMMALAAAPERGPAQGRGRPTARGRADGYSPAAAAGARAEAAMLRSQLESWQSVRTLQHADTAPPYQHTPYGAPAVPATAGAPAPPLFAAPAAGPGARSRLDMYEALEEHSQAAARRGRAHAAVATLVEERERAAAAAARAAAAAGPAGGGGGGGHSNADRQRREQETYGRGARARAARNGGSETGDSGAPGDAGGGAGAGPMGLAMPAGFPGLFMLGMPGVAAGRGAGGGGGGGGGVVAGAPRWSSRALHDILPMMAMGLHRGFMGMGPAEDDDDDGDGPGVNPLQPPHPGHPGAYRRGRHAAYREQARAMREQMVAAQRAGIPAHLLLGDRDFTPEDYEMLCRLDERVENRKGAKEEQLAALPTEVLTADNPRRRSDGAPATCAVCMEDLVAGETVKRIPCAHEFHENCIDQWLRTKANCPICQRGLDD